MAKGGFRGGMPMGGMNMNMIKQAQKMQQEMLKMQEEMESKEYEATAGGGMITAAVNGKHELLRLTIDPEAVELARRHIRQAGLAGRIEVTERDMRDVTLTGEPGVFIANPPYGERLLEQELQWDHVVEDVLY